MSKKQMIYPLDRLLLSKLVDCIEEEDEAFQVTLDDGLTVGIFVDDAIDIEALTTVLKRVLGVN